MEKIKQLTYTKEGIEKLKVEVEYLKNEKREEIKENLAKARSFGDLSENSEYDEARTEQAKNEANIKDIEEIISNAIVIDETKIDYSLVNVGSIVTVYDIVDDELNEYNIVNPNEVDPLENKISEQSPIGKALVGKKVGDKITVEAPVGQLHFEVRNIERAKK